MDCWSIEQKRVGKENSARLATCRNIKKKNKNNTRNIGKKKQNSRDNRENESQKKNKNKKTTRNQTNNGRRENNRVQRCSQVKDKKRVEGKRNECIVNEAITRTRKRKL